MSDIAKWNVHGPVETLRTEFATWDLEQKDWLPARHITLTSFRPNGTLRSQETHNLDGSISHSQWLYDGADRLTESTDCFNGGPINRTVYIYDETGRHVRTTYLSHNGARTDSEICTYDTEGKRTKISFFGLHEGNISYGIEGTDHSYSAPGATMMATTYDENDLPIKVLFQDASYKPLNYVILVRDSTGRLLHEEMHIGGESPFSNLLDKIPPEERARALTAFKDAFGEIFSSTTYVYDAQGRLFEHRTRMGKLAEGHTTYRYDDHDNPVEETTEDRRREASTDENGITQYTSNRLNVQHNQFEYLYDAHGNWIERIVSIQRESNLAFQRSNIERRIITYHAS